MGIKEGLLALLADGPRHGYQLKLDLEAATGDAISINVGQVYTTLQRLERDGLVRSGAHDNEGRAIYEITSTGVEVVREWVSSPENLAAAGRDEISIKVLLSLFTEGLSPTEVIENQRRSTMGLLQDFTQLRAQDNDADLAWQLHLDRLMYSAEAELKWLDRVEERLKKAKPVRRLRAESPSEERVK
ncbi:MAG TPA: PadR family transcriptional regulator [Acidimicrobiia bacterium]